LDDGSYGRCASCGEAISDERLEAVPATRFCAEHQTFWEGARLTVSSPGGPLPGERGTPLEAFMEAAAIANLDVLPGDDDVAEPVEVGPEERALHRTGGAHDQRRRMTGPEIELAEERHAEEEAED
jgi:hypothetical protein